MGNSLLDGDNHALEKTLFEKTIPIVRNDIFRKRKNKSLSASEQKGIVIVDSFLSSAKAIRFV
jgi:hypothetical protein